MLTSLKRPSGVTDGNTPSHIRPARVGGGDATATPVTLRCVPAARLQAKWSATRPHEPSGKYVEARATGSSRGQVSHDQSERYRLRTGALIFTRDA